MAKKPITVFITEGKPRRATDNQVWKVRIEGGKSDLEIPQKYTRVSSCKTGALRKLKAQAKITDICGYPSMVPFHEAYLQRALGIFTPDGREVVFIVKRKPNSK